MPSGTNLGAALVGIVAVSTLAVGLLTALVFGLFEAAIVFVVGWLFLVPVLGILMQGLGLLDSGDEVEAAVRQQVAESISEAGDGSSDGGRNEDPLEALRERYARGEIGDVEFERKLERLIETEDVEVPDGVSLDREGERGTDVAYER